MSGDVVALVAGTVLAVGALSFVLYPLFFSVSENPRRAKAFDGEADDSAIVALREIEFDRATGKLSEADYAELRQTYAKRALEELRSMETPGTPGTPDTPNAATGEPFDAIEARVKAVRMTHRECPTCGLRPEPDAIYCSTCGGYLERVCAGCGAEITESSAAYCSTCGATLAHGRIKALA